MRAACAVTVDGSSPVLSFPAGDSFADVILDALFAVAEAAAGVNSVVDAAPVVEDGACGGVCSCVTYLCV
jgi:hypothetical protein